MGCVGSGAFGGVGEFPGDLEPLCFAAGKGVGWLTQSEVAQAELLKHTQAFKRRGAGGLEEGNGLIDGEIKDIMD